MIHINKTKDLHFFIFDEKNVNEINIIDLGLNNGSFSKEIQSYFKNRAKIYGVEANQKTINYDLNIKTDNYLISNTSHGKEKLYLNDKDSGSSSSIFKENVNKFITVETITLEDYIKKYDLHINNIYVLKIDIEGKEFDILNEKLINFLSKCTYQICIEFHDFLVNDDRYKEKIKEIFYHFKKHNFIKINFSRNNGSVLFINKKLFFVNYLLYIKIYIYKYIYGIGRILKRL